MTVKTSLRRVAPGGPDQQLSSGGAQSERGVSVATLPLALPRAADLNPTSLPARADAPDHDECGPDHDAGQVGHGVRRVPRPVRENDVLQRL